MKNQLFLGMLFLILINNVQGQNFRDHITFGIGPSVLYSENAGLYTKFRVKPLPSFTFSYSYEYAQHWDFRASVGTQLFDGAGIQAFPQKRWIDKNQAYDTKGQAFYADFMPVYQFNPIRPGNRKHFFNYYAGLGLGLMQVQRDVKIGVSAPVTEESRSGWSTIEEEQRTTSLYFPLRLGISTNLLKSWDFGVEASALTAASYNLDGNTTKNKLIKPDMLVQFQFVIKHNLDYW